MSCLCGLSLTLALFVILAGLIYVFLVWNFNYWKKRGVKGPKPTPFIGNFPSRITKKRHIANELQDIYLQYHKDEDFVGVFSSRTPQLIVLTPELAHKVFVTDFKHFRDNEPANWVDVKSDKLLGNNPFVLCGNVWKERRLEITPGLTTSRIKAAYPVTQQVGKHLVKYLSEQCKSAGKDGIDGKDLSLRYTCEVVSDCVLGVKANCLSNSPTEVLNMSNALFQEATFFTIYPFLVGLWPQIKYFYKGRFFTKKTEKFFSGFVGSAIDFRSKSKQNDSRLDFLNFILELQKKKNLTIDDLTSQVMTFLVDGFESSATVISLCLYQLAKKPSTQEKLRGEILSSTNDNGEIDFEVLNAMPYLDQCIHESIRIMPPLLYSSKVCTETYQFTNRNGNKLTLYPEDIVLIPVYALHQDENIYPNHDEFIPERFDPENGGVKKFRDMGAFFPFGDGPRICMGMKFALTQTKAGIAEIIRNFNIKLNPKTRTDNKLLPSYFVGALEGGIWLDFEERDKS